MPEICRASFTILRFFVMVNFTSDFPEQLLPVMYMFFYQRPLQDLIEKRQM